MSIKSNIDMYYEALIDDLKGRKQWMIEGNLDVEPSEAEARALDDGLMYYVDQAYILAQALMSGRIQWGEEVDWQAIYDMLIEDMNGE